MRKVLLENRFAKLERPAPEGSSPSGMERPWVLGALPTVLFVNPASASSAVRFAGARAGRRVGEAVAPSRARGGEVGVAGARRARRARRQPGPERARGGVCHPGAIAGRGYGRVSSPHTRVRRIWASAFSIHILGPVARSESSRPPPGERSRPLSRVVQGRQTSRRRVDVADLL